MELTFPEGKSKGQEQLLTIQFVAVGLEGFQEGGLSGLGAENTPPTPVGSSERSEGWCRGSSMEQAMELMLPGTWASCQEPSWVGKGKEQEK